MISPVSITWIDYTIEDYDKLGIWMSDGWPHYKVEQVPQSRIDEAIAMTAGASV